MEDIIITTIKIMIRKKNLEKIQTTKTKMIWQKMVTRKIRIKFEDLWMLLWSSVKGIVLLCTNKIQTKIIGIINNSHSSAVLKKSVKKCKKFVKSLFIQGKICTKIQFDETTHCCTWNCIYFIFLNFEQQYVRYVLRTWKFCNFNDITNYFTPCHALIFMHFTNCFRIFFLEPSQKYWENGGIPWVQKERRNIRI